MSINLDIEVKFTTSHKIEREEFERYKSDWEQEQGFDSEGDCNRDWIYNQEEILQLWIDDNYNKVLDSGYSYGGEEMEITSDEPFDDDGNSIESDY
jgi:hypothetical protein